jgi:hypothetical protein
MTMTDDELAAAAAEVFKHFDRREAASERTVRLKKWALSVLCWDGALPLAVVAVPKLVSMIFANRQGAMELTFVIVPVVAFVIRYLNGISRYRNHQLYVWQLVVFFAAILLLFALDALLILALIVQNGPPESFWAVWFTLYGIYFAVMAIAMFPGRALAESQTVNAGPQLWDT